VTDGHFLIIIWR